MKSEMSLDRLRRQMPEWTWTAERDGMGWNYRGAKDGRSVLVFPGSTLCGFGDDDFRTTWCVRDGDEADVSYSHFWMQEGAT